MPSTDAGFDLPRVGKAYLTAQDPDTGERWRLKGEISMKTGKPTRLSEKLNAELDTIRQDYAALMASQTGELQDRFEQHCDHRAAYNRDRYPHLSATEQELGLTYLALADHGDHRAGIASMMAASLLWTQMPPAQR